MEVAEQPAVRRALTAPGRPSWEPAHWSQREPAEAHWSSKVMARSAQAQAVQKPVPRAVRPAVPLSSWQMATPVEWSTREELQARAGACMVTAQCWRGTG